MYSTSIINDNLIGKNLKAFDGNNVTILNVDYAKQEIHYKISNQGSPGIATFADFENCCRIGAIILHVSSSDYTLQTCTHEFKHYIGFTQVYDYCTKCDVKK